MIYNVSFYSAASRLPLGTLVMLMCIVQIISVLIIQRLVFIESICFFKIIVIPFIFAGLYLMFEPRIQHENFGSFVNTTTGSETEKQSRDVLGIILAIIGGIALSIMVAVINNKLQNVNVVIISMWLSSIGTLVSFVLAFYIDQLQFCLTLQQGLLVLCHSSAAAICAILTIFGSQNIPILSWAILDNLRILLDILRQYTVMRTVMPVSGNVYEICGMVITTACIFYSVGLDVYIEVANMNSQLL